MSRSLVLGENLFAWKVVSTIFWQRLCGGMWDPDPSRKDAGVESCKDQARRTGATGWNGPTLATTYFGHDLLWPRPTLAMTYIGHDLLWPGRLWPRPGRFWPTDRPPPDRPKFRAFFSSPTSIFTLSLSGGLLLNFGGVFEGQDPKMCTFGFSGCRVKPRRPQKHWASSTGWTAEDWRSLRMGYLWP